MKHYLLVKYPIGKIFCAFIVTVLSIPSLLSSGQAAAAAIWYVSNTGSDSSDGNSAETAWQTLDAVNMASLAPGDSVLFRRGDLWR